MFSASSPRTPWKRPPAPWEGPRGLDAVLTRWRGAGEHAGALVLDAELPAREAAYAALPTDLDPRVRAALEARGVGRLYRHQSEAFDLVRRRAADVVVATETASGKSLCYALPMLEVLVKNPAARALALFPTKALARDQEASLAELMRAAGLGHGAVTYDGDTPRDARKVARERSGLLITNPDMLHSGILPHHTSWARFFAGLELVVIDELHTYRGVFGSHLANVLRRLDRIARFHGASPRFVMASATIKNPGEHASRLIGRPVRVVGESGAPSGPRQVVVYNPPVVNRELGIRASTIKTAVKLSVELVEAGVGTLLFGPSRNAVEVMLKYVRDRLAEHGHDPEIAQGYRGGYLPETRRRIELGLRSGQVRCAVATNALELGIDIGELDAVVCAGFPGSFAALWQRFGRAGRRRGRSLGVLVASSSPLDQYLAGSPELVIRADVEEARIDPDNLEILLEHTKCAAFERPFVAGEGFGDLPPEELAPALEFLSSHRVLQPVSPGDGQTTFHWSSDVYPASAVSLRSASFDNFVIIDVERTLTIAEMDFRSAHTMLHEQAIYQHEAEQYQVERLDYENKKAFVRKVAPDYYTTAMTHTKVKVLAVEDEDGTGGPRLGHGDVDVSSKVVGYKKIKFHTHENVGYGEVYLPEVLLPTTSFWLTVPRAVIERAEAPRAAVLDAMTGVGNAMHAIAAIGLMIDPRDLRVVIVDGETEGRAPDEVGFDPTVFLYDAVAGGIGLAPRLFTDRQRLLAASAQMIARCGCDRGCPSCVGPEDPALGGAGPSRRAIALRLLGLLGVGGER